MRVKLLWRDGPAAYSGVNKMKGGDRAMFKKKMAAFMLTIVTVSGIANVAAPEQANAASSPNCPYRFCLYEDSNWDGWRESVSGSTSSGARNFPWIDTNEVSSLAWNSAGTYTIYDGYDQSGDWARWRNTGQAHEAYVGDAMNDRTNSFSWGPY